VPQSHPRLPSDHRVFTLLKTHGEMNHRPGARLSASSLTVLPTVRFSPATIVEFTATVKTCRTSPTLGHTDTPRRARAGFLRQVEPAIAGSRGTCRRFELCCRIVRGIDLSDDEAFQALSEWSARCHHPGPSPNVPRTSETRKDTGVKFTAGCFE
jgi:hypothetical protein